MSDLQSHSRITPFLWFDKNAEEAVDFYLSVFKNSRRLSELRNNSIDDPRMVPKGGVLTLSFELDGQRFTALNGGPDIHSPMPSPLSSAATIKLRSIITGQKLTAGGTEVACGWLKDKFGLSWQIVPSRIGELIPIPRPCRP